MPKTLYVERSFGAAAREKIEKANAIIDEYQAKGYELTLRQLYYQFVSRDFIANNQREYKNLGSVLNDARLAGLVDWNAIVDRTRNLASNSHWGTPADIIASAASSYHTDLWADQDRRVEVWIEKDALVGVIERVCKANDVAFFSCRGYTSQSELWAAGLRLARYRQGDQEPVVLHFGDHDPSGMDMTRDIQERLTMFARGEVEVKRLALNMNQIRQYNPPPNPVKLTDSRADGYQVEHGDESWELDALSPEVISDLAEDAIKSFRDEDVWSDSVAKMEKERGQLTRLSEQWEKVSKHIKP